MDFKLSPGARGTDYTGKPGYTCVDEDKCDNEVYFLCAEAQGAGIEYLTCIDSKDSVTDPATKAQACAASSGFKWPSISECFSGSQGQQLLSQASSYFDKKFPKPVGVPRIEINGVVQPHSGGGVYDALLKALCDTGIKAGACSPSVVV